MATESGFFYAKIDDFLKRFLVFKKLDIVSPLDRPGADHFVFFPFDFPGDSLSGRFVLLFPLPVVSPALFF
jgi:hypothetical protein